MSIRRIQVSMTVLLLVAVCFGPAPMLLGQGASPALTLLHRQVTDRLAKLLFESDTEGAIKLQRGLLQKQTDEAVLAQELTERGIRVCALLNEAGKAEEASRWRRDIDACLSRSESIAPAAPVVETPIAVAPAAPETPAAPAASAVATVSSPPAAKPEVTPAPVAPVPPTPTEKPAPKSSEGPRPVLILARTGEARPAEKPATQPGPRPTEGVVPAAPIEPPAPVEPAVNPPTTVAKLAPAPRSEPVAPAAAPSARAPLKAAPGNMPSSTDPAPTTVLPATPAPRPAQSPAPAPTPKPEPTSRPAVSAPAPVPATTERTPPVVAAKPRIEREVRTEVVAPPPVSATVSTRSRVSAPETVVTTTTTRTVPGKNGEEVTVTTRTTRTSAAASALLRAAAPTVAPAPKPAEQPEPPQAPKAPPPPSEPAAASPPIAPAIPAPVVQVPGERAAPVVAAPLARLSKPLFPEAVERPARPANEPAHAVAITPDSPNKLRSLNDIKVSLNFKDAEIADIARIIAEKAELNIVSRKPIVGRTTVRLDNVAVGTALDVILKGNDYSYDVKDGIVWVLQKGDEPPETMIFFIKHVRAVDLLRLVENCLGQDDAPPVAVPTYAAPVPADPAMMGGQAGAGSAVGSGSDAIDLSTPAAPTVAPTYSVLTGPRGAPTTRRANVILDDRANALIVTAPRRKLEEIARIIAAMDFDQGGGAKGYTEERIFKIKYIDKATLINSIRLALPDFNPEKQIVDVNRRTK